MHIKMQGIQELFLLHQFFSKAKESIPDKIKIIIDKAVDLANYQASLKRKSIIC